MTTGELLLNAAVLFIVLYRNLGTHAVNRRRFTIPVVIIAVIGYIFLRHVPTTGHDVMFDTAGLAAGVVLGAIAGLLIRVNRAGSGPLLTRAGAAFAVLWITVIAARVAFSEGATHLYTAQVTSWSMAHQISGSGAFTAMFVIMALAMIATMMLALAAHCLHVSHRSGTHRVAGALI